MKMNAATRAKADGEAGIGRQLPSRRRVENWEVVGVRQIGKRSAVDGAEDEPEDNQYAKRAQARCLSWQDEQNEGA